MIIELLTLEEVIVFAAILSPVIEPVVILFPFMVVELLLFIAVITPFTFTLLASIVACSSVRFILEITSLSPTFLATSILISFAF